MFTKLRQIYYKRQDEKEYKKYAEPEKQQSKKKIGSNQDKKGIYILVTAFSVVVLLIIVAVIVKNTLLKKSVVRKEEITAAVTTTHIPETEGETTTFYEETVVVETIPETVTTKRQKVKKEPKIMERTTTPPKSVYIPTTSKRFIPTTKPIKTTEVATRPKVNNKIPNQNEDNSMLGKANINLIRDSIISAANGKYDYNMQNLAVYMANKRMNDAQSAVNEILENTTLKVTSDTASATIYSTASEDILKAAEQLAEELGGSYSFYGVGINVSYKNGKYSIYAVVTTQK